MTSQANSSQLTEFDISQLRPGQTLEFRTKSGATYWITATTSMRIRDKRVFGTSIMSDSPNLRQIGVEPDKTIINRHVIVGEHFDIPPSGTSRVTEIKLLG